MERLVWKKMINEILGYYGFKGYALAMVMSGAMARLRLRLSLRVIVIAAH